MPSRSLTEQEPGTENTSYPRVKHEWAVKKFARPSVNLDNADVLSDSVRPPEGRTPGT